MPADVADRAFCCCHGLSGGGINDPRVLSDATPDNEWKPGAQYAQNRSGGGPPRYGRRFPEATPAQQARLAAAEAQANTAIRAVREIDPHWRRTPSIRETIEGQIAAEQAVAREARERLELFHRLGVTRETIRPDAPARPHEDILAPGGRLIGVRAPRAGDDVRTASAAAFERVRDESMAGARPIRAHESYEGLWFRRADGIRFGLRWSKDHGATIDIIESNSALIDQSFRIHWK